MKLAILKGKVLFLILIDIATLNSNCLFLFKTGWIVIWNIWFPEIKVEILDWYKWTPLNLWQTIALKYFKFYIYCPLWKAMWQKKTKTYVQKWSYDDCIHILINNIILLREKYIHVCVSVYACICTYIQMCKNNIDLKPVMWQRKFSHLILIIG